MRRVYICSPLRAATAYEIEQNRLLAIEYCGMVEEVLGRVAVKAVAPHAYLPLLLDDTVPYERELALQFGKKLLSLCEAIFVCGEVLSEGMKGEIMAAHRIPIIVHELSLWDAVKTIAPKECKVITIYELMRGGA